MATVQPGWQMESQCRCGGKTDCSLILNRLILKNTRTRFAVRSRAEPINLLPPKRTFDTTSLAGLSVIMKKASTFRLHQDVQAGLDFISQLQRRPKNKLVNEAVAEYVTRHALQTEDELQTILKRVKTYQKSDPDFARAIAAFAEAEATYGKDEDPMEGHLAPPAASVGPITRQLRNLINA